MKRSLRKLIRARAQRRCEYCQLHEDDLPATPFHVEHIVPKKHGGKDDPKTLAWSCQFCNLSRSSNLRGRDIETGRIVTLINPRRQRWERHFAWDGAMLTGLTACGRATIDVLNMNTSHRVELRTLLIEAGAFPPD